MTWEYRVVRKVCPTLGEPYCGFYEVFYSRSGGIAFMTEDAVEPHGETERELADDLGRMLKALDKPTLDYAEIKFEVNPELGDMDKCDRHDFNVPQV